MRLRLEAVKLWMKWYERGDCQPGSLADAGQENTIIACCFVCLRHGLSASTTLHYYIPCTALQRDGFMAACTV